ncbi:MAG: hypothetical protein J0H69_19630 [Burkholderiales bacterium]|nr:hypothetical protein [Burkholderiales bacterium]
MLNAQHTHGAACTRCEGFCLADKPALPSVGMAPALHIGQRVRHCRDYGAQRVIGVIRTLTWHTEEGTLKADILLDDPIVIPASEHYGETRIWSQFVPAHELTPYDERDDLIAELLASLMHCTTDEGPDQAQLDCARALIAKATGAPA